MNIATMLKKPSGRFGLIASIAVVIILYFIISGNRGSSSSLPDYPVKRGDFIVSITETGELGAKNSVVVRSPSVRTNLQVLWLAEKGSHVEEGDTLVVFDGTEVQQRIEESRNKLEAAEANRQKTLSTQASAMADLEARLKSVRDNYRLAQLRLERMQFESEIDKEEQTIASRQSLRDVEQAEEHIKQQIIINRADLRTIELNVKQAEISLEEELNNLGELTILAPQPGLVVYMKLWNGSNMAELRVGDTPWRRQALVELPDLSEMVIETSVNEVDVSQVEVGQRTTIVPDAFPDHVYTGIVIDVAGLGREDEESEAEVKIFDVKIQLDEADEILKPGMTVSATIIVNEIADTLFIPLDAVFTFEGNPIVYRSNAGFRRTQVELGMRNDNFVVVLSGLDEDDRVSLVDPNTSFDSSTWSGIEEPKNGAPTIMNGGNDS
ncbi:MAG TPA: HlyD family efflux transporter periplasmic adaptor subunit [Bacteroidetes bacterium]|nr:macrolide export protein MacA [bacterium BMS3Bbin04]HDO65024.1 HlyD family efflux transporter periplasmic adaptor subunit [Bacteroidota bacterium]HEX04149.1 HlyD family efflux transporter periplasmic adaptor subunit [Bacteroidota bacterium]